MNTTINTSLARKYFAVLITALCVVFGVGELQASNPKPDFATSYQEQRYSLYLKYSNNIHENTVRYLFGEPVLHKPDEDQLIYLTLDETFTLDRVIRDTMKTGKNTGYRTLLNEGKSRAFIIPQGGLISFFRMLYANKSVRNQPERYDIDDDLPDNPPLNFPPVYASKPHNTISADWEQYASSVIGRTEYVVELVRTTDNRVIAVLDSIGVYPDPKMGKPMRYGTNPDLREITVPLPSKYAGISAYIRVSPRRYGVTQPILFMHRFISRIRQSLFYPNSDTLSLVKRRLDTMFIKTMHKKWVDEVLRYYDSVGRATGFEPMTLRSWSLSTDYIFQRRRENYDSIGVYYPSYKNSNSRFLQLVDASRPNIQWYRSTLEPPIVNPFSDSSNKYIYSVNEPRKTTVKYLTFTDNARSGSVQRFQFIRDYDGTCEVVLHDVSGKKIGMLYTGQLSKNVTGEVQLPDLSQGIYFVAVQAGGKIIDSQGLLIGM